MSYSGLGCAPLAAEDEWVDSTALALRGAPSWVQMMGQWAPSLPSGLPQGASAPLAPGSELAPGCLGTCELGWKLPVSPLGLHQGQFG